MTFQSTFAFLKASVEKIITIKGQFSKTPWQHLMAPTKDYPYDYYFDLEDGFQIVVYSKSALKEISTPVELTGKIISVVGQSKRPIPSKGEDFIEYHLLIEKITPLC